jgi:hypothetical protein
VWHPYRESMASVLRTLGYPYHMLSTLLDHAESASLKNILNKAVRAVRGYAAVLERLHTHQLGVEQRVLEAEALERCGGMIRM